MIPIQMTDLLIAVCGPYGERRHAGSKFPFKVPIQSNLMLVTGVVVQVKLNEQSADRRAAKTNLLLENERLSNF